MHELRVARMCGLPRSMPDPETYCSYSHDRHVGPDSGPRNRGLIPPVDLGTPYSRFRPIAAYPIAKVPCGVNTDGDRESASGNGRHTEQEGSHSRSPQRLCERPPTGHVFESESNRNCCLRTPHTKYHLQPSKGVAVKC